MCGHDSKVANLCLRLLRDICHQAAETDEIPEQLFYVVVVAILRREQERFRLRTLGRITESVLTESLQVRDAITATIGALISPSVLKSSKGGET